MVFDGRDVGKAEDIRLTAVSGNVELRTTGTGDIKDSHRQENGDRAFVNATNGNVTIRHEGTGNVDLYGLYAKKEAATELKNGSLYLDTMDGDLVAMFVRNPDKVMDVKHITAGQEIAVAGADIGIDDILQREGAEGLLTITPTGASDDAPIKNLHIGDIRTNEGSGVRFKHLWLENGDVSVSKGQLLLDKLYVLDKARFSNGVMTTNVFGSPRFLAQWCAGREPLDVPALLRPGQCAAQQWQAPGPRRPLPGQPRALHGGGLDAHDEGQGPLRFLSHVLPSGPLAPRPLRPRRCVGLSRRIQGKARSDGR